MKRLKVAHYANSIAGALYNKVKSSETPTRTGTVIVKCLLSVKHWPKRKSLHISAKYTQRRCVSDSCRQAVQCAFSVIC